MKGHRLVLLSLLIALGAWTGLGGAQQPKPGGTLRIALSGDLTFLNANQGPAPGYETFWIWNNIFNSLLSMTPPPALQIVPELAQSWDVLDEGKTYVFHLVEGVTFHDGTEFDARAAKWNFERILTPDVKSWVRPYYEEIDTIEAVDKYTLRVRMKEPSGALPTILAGYFQGIPMASPTSFTTYDKEWVHHPAGTGPYRFKEWVPGKHILLEKNPTYFKPGLPYLDTIEFRVMKDPLTASAALRSGEVDLIARVPIQQALILEKTSGITVLTGPAMAPTVAVLNMRVKPFDDVRARRAVGGYGLDRVEIAKVAFHGRSKPLVSVLAQGVPDAVDLNEMYPYNPEEAKRLLKELGYDAQHPLQFTILVPNHDSTLADVAALVKSQLAKIGVEAKLNLMDLTAVIDRFVVKHDFDMCVSSFADLLDINMRSVSFFKDSQANYLGMDDPQLEELVHQWRRSLEPAKRLAISADIQRLLAEQMYWVNVAGYPFFRAHTGKVKGFPFYGQAYLFLESTWLDK